MNSHHVSKPIRTAPCIECGKIVEIAPKASVSKTTCSEVCRDARRKKSFAKFSRSEKGKQNQKRYAQTEKRKLWHKSWSRKYFPGYNKKKRLTDPQFRIATSLRARLGSFVRGKTKQAPTQNYLGCTWAELRAWLEKQFQPGMSWENYGRMGWHIDHKRPMASSQLVNENGTLNEAEIAAAMHHTNLQPLWYWQNASKSDNYISAS
jgi:hypothetical protein